MVDWYQQETGEGPRDRTAKEVTLEMLDALENSDITNLRDLRDNMIADPSFQEWRQTPEGRLFSDDVKALKFLIRAQKEEVQEVAFDDRETTRLLLAGYTPDEVTEMRGGQEERDLRRNAGTDSAAISQTPDTATESEVQGQSLGDRFRQWRAGRLEERAARLRGDEIPPADTGETVGGGSGEGTPSPTPEPQHQPNRFTGEGSMARNDDAILAAREA